MDEAVTMSVNLPADDDDKPYTVTMTENYTSLLQQLAHPNLQTHSTSLLQENWH
jgi:hypothetical protein